MSKTSVRFAVLLIAIVAVGAVVNTWAYLGEAHVDRKPLKDFPAQVGDWRRAGQTRWTMRRWRSCGPVIISFATINALTGHSETSTLVITRASEVRPITAR